MNLLSAYLLEIKSVICEKIRPTNYSKVHPLLCRLANEYGEMLSVVCNFGHDRPFL